MFKLNRYISVLAYSLIILSTTLICASVIAKEPAHTSHEVQQHSSVEVAELLLGIIHFSRWPDSAKDLQLCIVGETEHTEFLLSTDLSVGEFVIDTRWVDETHLLSEVNTCQVLYFGHYDTAHINDFYAVLYGNPVLTIDEWNEACRVGGMFCLSYSGDRLGFKVNLDAVGRSQVRIHPGVLRLGQRRVSE